MTEDGLESKAKLKEIVDCIETKGGLLSEMDNSKSKYKGFYDSWFNSNLSGWARKENKEAMENTELYYSLLKAKAVKLGIDITKYPENLEDLIE